MIVLLSRIRGPYGPLRRHFCLQLGSANPKRIFSKALSVQETFPENIQPSALYHLISEHRPFIRIAHLKVKGRLEQ